MLFGGYYSFSIDAYGYGVVVHIDDSTGNFHFMNGLGGVGIAHLAGSQSGHKRGVTREHGESALSAGKVDHLHFALKDDILS